MSEKELPPTEKRLQDAKEEGQSPVSKDVLNVAVVTVVLEIIFALEPMWRTAFIELCDLTLYVISFDYDNAFFIILERSFYLLVIATVLVYLVAVALSFVATWSHVGFIFAIKIFQKAFDKLNPATALKGLISMTKLAELLLSLFRFAIILVLTYKVIDKRLPSILLLPYGSLLFAWTTFFDILKEMMRTILLALGVFMFVDMKIKNMFHIKNLKMSHDEVKREYKESQGDPMIKSRRRQLAMEMLSEGPERPAKNANAVVSNPKHYAVALYYDALDCPVPIVIDKGVEADAKDIIKIAHDNDIPVVEFVWLARTLFSVGRIDQTVPRFAYKAVAFVYHFIKNVLDPQIQENKPIERTSLDDLYAQIIK